MLKIRLFCAGGMSTSLLAEKIRKAGRDMGIEVDVEAHGVGRINRLKPEDLAAMDVALLGPQVGYAKGNYEKIFADAGVPMDVIPMRAYGMVDGKAVLELALSMVKK